MSLAVEPTKRFSNRVENYRRYRPGYPREVFEFLQSELGLNQTSVVADVGSGTGIFSKALLEIGCTVYGVEPNAEMRAAGAEFVSGFDKFTSVEGAAENTNLNDNSVDFVTAAQAFHWFRRDEFEKETRRILKNGGYLVLIWNTPQIDSTDFARDYERFKTDFGTDFDKVKTLCSHSDSADNDFLQQNFESKTFANSQKLDIAGLIGRALSSSYIPTENEPGFADAMIELIAIFARHQRDDQIEMLYDTEVYYKRF